MGAAGVVVMATPAARPFMPLIISRGHADGAAAGERGEKRSGQPEIMSQEQRTCPKTVSSLPGHWCACGGYCDKDLRYVIVLNGSWPFSSVCQI
jgi:hypothetical protein